MAETTKKPAPPPEQKALTDLSPVLLVTGQPGSGKSTGIENLPKDSTAILNVERKLLPFRKARDFKMQTYPTNFQEFYKHYQAMLANPKVKIAVVDSLTSVTEQLETYCLNNWQKTDTFAVWRNYNMLLNGILQKAKESGKQVIFIGHEELLMTDDGVVGRRTRTFGKRWKGMIEKEFAIVLWSLVEMRDGEPQHLFMTRTDGERPAKAPREMFEERYIENDYQAVLTKVDAYYKTKIQ